MGESSPRPAVLVIGVGNPLRHDDAVGLEVARRAQALVEDAASSGRMAHAREARIAICEQEGEPLALLEAWEGADAVVLVDAMHRPHTARRTGPAIPDAEEATHGAAPAGTIQRLDASTRPLPADLSSSSSTHALGLAGALELGRALGRLPARVILYGVVGARFDAGVGLSPAVQEVVGQLAARALREANELSRPRSPTPPRRASTARSPPR
ncbi:MAG TPA: hydrogenase maturation protease [Solirubrobacteraceae bacterium]|nr:hydrogenase maturation protease [Solirubrobacteraceae bacterium]